MKGIMFKPDMIQAIREGRKTVTRRLAGLDAINKEPDSWELPTKVVRDINPVKVGDWLFPQKGKQYRCVMARPRYLPGETVYVKEAWAVDKRYDHMKAAEINRQTAVTIFAKDDPSDWEAWEWAGRWRSPRFMPEWAARTFLVIKDVRPERLQEITLEDCWDEGIRSIPSFNRIDDYHKLWDSINKMHPWVSNPWVWRIEFENQER